MIGNSYHPSNGGASQPADALPIRGGRKSHVRGTIGNRRSRCQPRAWLPARRRREQIPRVSVPPALRRLCQRRAVLRCRDALLRDHVSRHVQRADAIDPFTFTSLRYLTAGMAFLVLLVSTEGRPRSTPTGSRCCWPVPGTVGFAGFGFSVPRPADRRQGWRPCLDHDGDPTDARPVNSIGRRVLPPRYSLLFILLSFCGVILVVTKGDIAGSANRRATPRTCSSCSAPCAG